MRAPMVEARARVYGIHPELAKDPLAETVIGRWCLTGEITRRQWAAADQYLKDARAYSIAVEAPRGARAVAIGGVGGASVVDEETEFEVERSISARKRYSDVLTCIVGAELVYTGVSEALASVVLRGHDYPDAVGLVRLGLNALARMYNIPEYDLPA